MDRRSQSLRMPLEQISTLLLETSVRLSRVSEVHLLDVHSSGKACEDDIMSPKNSSSIVFLFAGG